jgi:hypothetical protein
MAKKVKTKGIENKRSKILETIAKEKAQDERLNTLKVTPDKAEGQEEKNNKLLIAVFSLLGLVLIAFFAGYFLIESKNSFSYKGVEFNKIQEGNLVFYNTQLPVYSNRSNTSKKVLTYNFYLRNDPRELAKMDFNETIIPLKLMAINYSEDMNCNGYGIIALTNIINLYQLIGAKVTVDKNATCDPEGRYMFLNLQKANETSLEKVGNNCYNLNVKNCDVFPPTERLMIDTFVKIKQEGIRAVSSGTQSNTGLGL